MLFCSSKAYRVLKISISWGVRRLNLKRISFFIESSDASMSLTCLKSELGLF